MSPTTKYKIEQGSTYLQEDWWKWWLYLEASDKDLDAVDYVLYKLHPTFSPPVVKVLDRSSGFKMETEGWGIFTIYAIVYLKNGETINLEHELELFYPSGKQNFE